eukprot:1158478-Pelagomonas_calceolata.AAC.3
MATSPAALAAAAAAAVLPAPWRAARPDPYAGGKGHAWWVCSPSSAAAAGRGQLQQCLEVPPCCQLVTQEWSQWRRSRHPDLMPLLPEQTLPCQRYVLSALHLRLLPLLLLRWGRWVG